MCVKETLFFNRINGKYNKWTNATYLAMVIAMLLLFLAIAI